jgi:hypothetical protein
MLVLQGRDVKRPDAVRARGCGFAVGSVRDTNDLRLEVACRRMGRTCERAKG